MKNKVYDCLVIGAGPVGLYTAFYCGLRKLNTILVDSLEIPGGQMSNQYPEKIVYDLPGFLEITAGEFITKLEEQVASLPELIDIQMNTKITQLDKEDDLFIARSDSSTIVAKSVILAMGNGSFVPIKLELENEEHYTNINYFVQKTSDYVDKDVVVLGGGDSAIDWAMMLEPLAKSVTLVHRRDQFRAKLSSVEKLKQSKVNIITSFVPKELKGDNDALNSIIIESVKDQSSQELFCDELIVSYGTISSINYLQEWGLDVINKKVEIDLQSKTHIDGIFAAGDVTTYQGREIQIVLGLAEGMQASAAANQYLHKGIKQRPIR